MTVVQRALFVSTGLATGLLALGYGLSGQWTWSPLIVAVGLLWLLGQWRGWGWVASVGLVVCAGIAILGFWADLGVGWLWFGMVAALTTWDLDHFVRRMRSVHRVERAGDLERRHLQRLLIVNGLSLLITAVALGIEIKFSFATALLLGALAVLGLSQAIGFLMRQSD